MKNLLFSFKYLLGKVLNKDLLFDSYLKDRPVLDIGCGRGDLLKKDPVNFFGIDANETSIKALISAGYKVKLAKADNLPFADNYFSSVYCANVIEHLNPEEAYKLLTESSRVLKSNGFFILISPMPKYIWNTFGHIKPYPPLAIKKILRPISREKNNSIQDLVIDKIFYLGRWPKIKALFFLSSVLANLIPWGRSTYVLILKKIK